MDTINTAKALKLLKIRLESSTMVLTNVMTSEWQLGLLCSRLKLKMK
jgi:hypothetical protein